MYLFNLHTTIPPRPRWRVFLLPCIRHGAGLFFCLDAIQHNTSVYSVFCIVHAVIPPAPQNSAQSFTGAFPAIFLVLPPLCVGCICLYCTTCATLERITAPGRPAPIPDTRRSAGRCTGSSRRRSRCFPRPAAGGLAPVNIQCAPGQPGTLHPAGKSSGRGASVGAEPLAATAVSLFGLSPDS